MIVPLLPAFLGTLGIASVAMSLGWIEGVADSSVGLLKLWSGWWSDKIRSRKPLVIAGYSLSMVMRPAIALSTLGWHVIVLRFADRVGKGIRTAPRDALVAASCSPEDRGRAFGFQRAMDNAGAVVGPLIASALLLAFAVNDNKYRWIFALALIPGIIAVALLFLVREERPESSAPHLQSPSSNLKPLPQSFWRYLVVVLLFTLGNSSDLFLLLRARDIGVPDGMLPALWSLLQAVKALTAWYGGILSDRLGRRPMLIAGWMIYAGCYIGFAHVSSILTLIMLLTLYGCYYGCVEPTERALVADIIADQPSARGTAYGFFNCAVSIGALPASVMFGWLWHQFDAFTAFHFGATLALAAALGLMLVKFPKR